MNGFSLAKPVKPSSVILLSVLGVLSDTEKNINSTHKNYCGTYTYLVPNSLPTDRQAQPNPFVIYHYILADRFIFKMKRNQELGMLNLLFSLIRYYQCNHNHHHIGITLCTLHSVWYCRKQKGLQKERENDVVLITHFSVKCQLLPVVKIDIHIYQIELCNLLLAVFGPGRYVCVFENKIRFYAHSCP